MGCKTQSLREHRQLKNLSFNSVNGLSFKSCPDKRCRYLVYHMTLNTQLKLIIANSILVNPFGGMKKPSWAQQQRFPQ